MTNQREHDHRFIALAHIIQNPFHMYAPSTSIEKYAVSVVVPAYNAARTIGDAIQSVLNGAFDDFEIVICDDASTDKTVDVVRAFNDPRVRLVCNAENSGEGFSRDRAIALAKGEWIAVLDADDAYTPDRLDVLVAAARQHPNCIVFDEIMECHDTAYGMKKWRTVRSSNAFPGKRRMLRPVRTADWISQKRTVIKPLIPTALIRRHNIKHSNKRCSADMDFFLKLLAQYDNKLWYIPEPMYLYRMTPNSMSSVVERYTLTESTLRSAMAWFSGQPEMLSALRKAILRIRRAEEYRMFINNLKRLRMDKAIKHVLTQPWVIHELINRSAKQVPYNLSRLRHGGQRRKRI